MIQCDLYDLFDRVNLINLERRTDRLASVQTKIAAVDWPFRPLEVINAIDGDKCREPAWFESGNRAWGCLRSHLKCLENALNDGVNSILILEDDLYFYKPESFGNDVRRFFQECPADWEVIFLGGQHHQPSLPLNDAVVKGTNIQRTHGYALRGKVIGDLYKFWCDCKTHCDWPLGIFTANYKCYAPADFLLGQDEGQSDIRCTYEHKRSWNHSARKCKVIAVKGRRDIAEALRTNGYHGGYSRNDGGVDTGFVDAMQTRDHGQKVSKLVNLINMLGNEVTDSGHKAVMLWPCSDLNAIKQACPDVVYLESPTVAQADAAIKGESNG